MKKLIFFYLLATIQFIFCGVKIDRIAVIDIDFIIENVFSDNSEQIKLIKKEKEELQNNLKKIEENIIKLKEAKLKETEESKKIAIDRKIEELKQQYNDYYKVTTYQIEQKMKTIREPIFKQIYQIVKRISEEEGFSIVFDLKTTEGIFYYSIESNITQMVIDKLKKKD